MRKTELTVLIAPLNWGLGHATRCIPLIKSFIAHSCKVVICSDGASLSLLKKEFPELTFEELPEFSIKYSKKRFFFNSIILKQLPYFFKSIKADNETAKHLVDKYKPNIIISDNRYGFYNDYVFSIFLTHQIKPIINIKANFLKQIIYKKLWSLMGNFNEIWVPDYPESPSLSGKLSHNTAYKNTIKYCGPLSRFENTNVQNQQFSSDILAIVSGPEPSRTQFEDYLKDELQNINYKTIIFSGTPEQGIKEKQYKNLQIFTHLKTDIFQEYITNTKLIIARSGYSTIMDAYIMQKKTIIIATPRQSEQEYLVELHKNSELFYPIIKADSLKNTIDKILSQTEQKSIKPALLHDDLISETIQNIESKCGIETFCKTN